MLEAITKLIKVKTLVTLILTGVFAFLSCTGKIDADKFITIFTVVISFYFGTQAERYISSSTAATTQPTEPTEGVNK